MMFLQFYSCNVQTQYESTLDVMSKYPRVGVGVLIFRGDKILVGKRSAQ